MCQHHYELESGRAATVKGICRKCGEVKDFQNQLDHTINPNVLKDVHVVGANSPAYWERYVDSLARHL